MNTKAVKSFGLALMLAAGVLAVLLALGTFSPQKAAAQANRRSGPVTSQPHGLPEGRELFQRAGSRHRNDIWCANFYPASKFR